MPDNARYRAGAIWKTRTLIPKAQLDSEDPSELQKLIDIPKGEYVMLLSYTMNRNFEEHCLLLWDNKTVFVYNIDTAYQFDIDPKGVNTKKTK